MRSIYTTWLLKFLNSFLLFSFFCSLLIYTNNLNGQCNPKSLYDNLVAGYHGAIAKQPNGSFVVWGEYMQNNGTSHALSPQLINTANYPLLTGTPLFASLGGDNNHQAILLTTTGLFAWGYEGMVLDGSITSSRVFQKLTINSQSDGLPAGIDPGDVRMMFTSNQLLAILTNSGFVYVISQIAQARGIGGGGNATQWYQVTSSASGNPAISNITAIRGNGRGSMMALSSQGTGILYTWGASTFLGDGTAGVARSRATQMTLPGGVSGNDIKMIGMTARTTGDPSSHYILTNSGSLYGLGENTNRQLGDFTTTDRTSWVNVQKTSGNNFTDCIFFSPNEHDITNAAVGAIDANYDLYTWGINDESMLGRTGSPVNPGLPAGFITGTDNAFLVEIGGHISLSVKESSTNYCYLGHRTNGSMGDGSSSSSTITSWNCSSTGTAQICGGSSFDAGDVPNSYEGNGNTDYCTHNIAVANSGTLYLGSTRPTANNFNFRNVAALADNNNTNGDGTQEDGLPATVSGVFIGNSSYHLSVTARNTTGVNANLYGWVDWNRDGDFLDSGEMVSTVVTSGSNSAVLNYTTLPAGIIPGVKYYIRLRFTSGTLTSPLGYAPDGEVEDYYMKAVQLTPDVNNTLVNVAVSGNVSTNEGIPAGTVYGTPVALPGNPNPSALPTINAAGVYSFTTSVAGIYYFNVPVCPPGQSSGCPMMELKITVLDPAATNNKPVANTDIATTSQNTAVTINTLANDNSGNTGIALNLTSVTITGAPGNGTTSVNSSTGQITYTPNSGFVGIDILSYQVCDMSSPTPQCASARQIITVLPTTGKDNFTAAADDYNKTPVNTQVSGNVLNNDTDPDNSNTQTVTSQNTTIPGVGTLVLNTNGSYTFTPVTGYTGPATFPYQVCDNGGSQACANATLYILTHQVSVVPVRLIQFSGQRKDNDVIVKWNTENEINVSHYEIEYGRDGMNFAHGGSVAAKSQTSPASYQFILVNYTQPLYYIRLKSVDKDGRYEYNGIIRITRDGTLIKSITVIPNPVTDVFTFRITSNISAGSSLRLINNLGQVVYQKNMDVIRGNNLFTIHSLNHLPGGAYTVQCLLDGELMIAKVFKL